MNTLALDIGGTKIAAAIIDDQNQFIKHQQIQTPSSSTPEQLMLALEEMISPFIPQVDIVAAASTGIIHQGDLTALNPENLGGLKNFPLQSFIQQLTQRPCWVINDAHAATWAEFSYSKDNLSDLIFITISTGVGGGIVYNNELIQGKNALAGHVGHMLADPHGPMCGCGRRGCVEAIASGRAIAEAATDELSGMSAKQIFDHYYQGNPQATSLIERSASAIAALAVDLKAMMDTQSIVLGGSVGLAPKYCELVKQKLRHSPKILQPLITKAYYSKNAGLLGAALWAKKQQAS